MGVLNRLNAIQMIKDGLEKEVKEAVTEKLVKDELLAYEEKLRVIIKGVVEKITFQSINNVDDMLRMRNELHVFLRWDDKNE